MEMILLCGGLGSRLRKVIGESQKTMVSINGKPFLKLLIDYYKKNGIDRFILACGYKSNEVLDYFKNNKEDVEIVCVEEKEKLGTAGAIKNCFDFIKNDLVYVANGDTLFKVDITKLEKNMTKINSDISIMLNVVHNADRYGEVELDYVDDKSGRIINFYEKKKQTDEREKLINGGIYLMRKDLINDIEKNKNVSLEKEMMPKWVREKIVGGVVGEGDFLDIGTESSIKEAFLKKYE